MTRNDSKSKIIGNIWQQNTTVFRKEGKSAVAHGDIIKSKQGRCKVLSYSISIHRRPPLIAQ